MAQVYSPDRTQTETLVPALGVGLAYGGAMLLFVALLTAVALFRQSPPDALSESAPAAVFSSGRALKHLEAISRSPRPIGSTEHASAREYIVKELAALGAEPEVQSATAVSGKQGDSLRAARVQNVVGRLKGSQSTRAVLVAGHYDSVPNSPGASDDGAAVAAMLETLRALKAGPALKNDVIFLFTDGEEMGLLGARAFVDEHPLAKETGLVLNFEARGSGGPAAMFETSNGNGWLIENFAEAAPHPSANSLAYEIYRRLPNDTDLTVFRQAEMPGLNFAYIDGFTRYHTRADNIENLDGRSLQHQGSYALALTRRFGELNLADSRESSDAVYTDILGVALLRYSTGWVWPLIVFAALAFALVSALGFKRGRLTVKGIVLACAAFALGVVAAALTATLAWWLIRTVQGLLGRGLQDDFYQSKYYMAGFIALSVAAVAAVYNLFRRRVNDEELTTGAQFGWLVLLVLVGVAMPGASYLLTWPLLFSLAASLYAFGRRGREGAAWGRFVVLAACAVPAIILFVPTIYQVFIAMGLGMAGVAAALVALLLGLLVHQSSMITGGRRWLVPGASALVGAVLVVVAALSFNFDRRHPKADNVSYVLDADAGKAIWASSDAAPDEWTAQFFPANSQRASISDYTPSSGIFLRSDAAVAPLAAAEVSLLEDTTTAGVRSLRMRVAPPHSGMSVSVLVDPRVEVLAAVVDGKRVENKASAAAGANRRPWSLQYGAPSGGFDLTLEVKSPEPVLMKVVERRYGLPEIPGMTIRPRPDHLMPTISANSDTTIVNKTYTF